MKLSELFSVISIIISISSFVFSIVSLCLLTRYQHSTQEDATINMLMEVEEKINSTSGSKNTAYRERYINILDYISYKYLHGKIDKDMFEDNILNIIKDASNDSKYKNYISKDTTKNFLEVIDKFK